MSADSILVIDGDPRWQSALGQIAGQLGLDVAVTSTLTEARGLLLQRRFSLIAMDLTFPDVDASALPAHFGALDMFLSFLTERCSDTRILIISSEIAGNARALQLKRDAIVAGFEHKATTTPQGLIKAFRNLLSAPEARSEATANALTGENPTSPKPEMGSGNLSKQLTRDALSLVAVFLIAILGTALAVRLLPEGTTTSVVWIVVLPGAVVLTLIMVFLLAQLGLLSSKDLSQLLRQIISAIMGGPRKPPKGPDPS